MNFKTRSFIAQCGERFSQLYSSAEAFPLFYPTAFISRSVRLRTTSETQKVYLEAIKRLCEWEAESKIDLQLRFQRNKFLTPHEIDSLVRHLNAARQSRSGTTISPIKGNAFVAYATQYLDWLANEVITDPSDTKVDSLLAKQRRQLSAKLSPKTGSYSAKNQRTLEKRLPDNALDHLRVLWNDPFLGVFRPADRGSRMRTIIMLRILYETGMRRGEILSLKLKNFLESTGGSGAQLVIEKNHNDEYDSRINQPVAKSEGRIVPITVQAERQLLEYISHQRADVPRVGFDDEDFIFVTHRTGRGQGRPLSISNLDQALASLKKSFPALKGVHFHLLRHDWNFRFSKASDASGCDPIKEAEYRRLLMGWSESSAMPRLYNRRHLQEEASTIGLKVANDTGRLPLHGENSNES